MFMLMIALDRSTMNTAKAAFSKSVIWTSMLRNSTRHPMREFKGGGLNLKVCQLVDWIFYAWARQYLDICEQK